MNDLLSGIKQENNTHIWCRYSKLQNAEHDKLPQKETTLNVMVLPPSF